LALAHGGSLTVNPQTGLPEAGFLKNLLPTLIGAGLMFATGGTGAALIPGLSNAATIGLGVGGIQALRTGSLKKGLMAGLGAYGGAGLMGSIANVGTGAISQAAGANAVVSPPVVDAGTSLVQPSVTPLAPTGAVVPPAYPSGTLGSGTFDPLGGGVLNTGVEGTSPLKFADVGVPSSPYVTPTVAASPATFTSTVPATDPAALELAQQRAIAERLAAVTPMETAKAGIETIAKDPSRLLNATNLKYGAAALAPTLFTEPKTAEVPRDTEQFRYAYNPGRELPPSRIGDVGEYTYFRPSYARLAADGGLMDLPVERMSDRNDAQMTMANGGQMYAAGGISHLGDYSDGGRLLRGPGDGVSDDIPASIADKRPARLADGEFVVPARIVSELGNGSTDAGARKLYSMMDRVQKNRGKTTGKGKVAVDSRSEKLLPA
jgi:hypothetical protein